MQVHVTLYFVALFALSQVVITNLVGFMRVQKDIHFYDENDVSMRRNMRAHANFIETVPITLLGMLAAELAGAPVWLLVAGGLVLIAGRAMNYWILRAKGWGTPRAISMVLTFIAMGGFPIFVLWSLTTQ